MGFSFSNYTSRDFTLATSETIDLRGVPVNVSDTLLLARRPQRLPASPGSYRLGTQWAVGGGFHIITGSNRLTSTRVFDDPASLSSRQRAELSFAGVGFSVGVTRQFGPNFAVSAMARSDGHVNVDRDSARVGTVDLPYTLGLGLRWRPAPKLDLAGQALVRTWSGANSDLLALGGTGAQNTIEAAVGAEYTSDPKRPYQRPLRLGAHYATLPFPSGARPSRARNSGCRRAAACALPSSGPVWTSRSNTSGARKGVYSENGFIISLGVSRSRP